MKKFLLKSSFFILPFLLIHLLNSQFYKQDQGDLIRLGYLYSNPSPKESIRNQYLQDRHFQHISEINYESKTKFNVLTIGDSFSGQGSLGYQNFLASHGVSILNADRFISGENPIQTLIQFINSKLFKTIKVDAVVLQIVEVSSLKRSRNLLFSERLKPQSLKNKIKNYNKNKSISSESFKAPLFFSKTTLKIPITNLLYSFYANPNHSKTYKVSTTTNKLFSGNPDNLLFYHKDIPNPFNNKNNVARIMVLNKQLNKINDMLQKKNIQLIVLISPDKYDLYYPYIVEQNKFEKSLYFSYLDNLPKSYNYIPSFDILSKEIKNNKDVYYYYDTHWSPVAAKVIANEIYQVMEGTKKE